MSTNQITEIQGQVYLSWFHFPQTNYSSTITQQGMTTNSGVFWTNCKSTNIDI